MFFFFILLSVALSTNPFEDSGYILVNEKYNTNLYYTFLPSKDGNDGAPIILWLQGGPGVSSIGDGLFNENGPFYVSDDLTLIENKNSWNNEFHLLYIDQPAGAGFSYTDANGYVHFVDESSEELYSALIAFFQNHEDLKENDFYVASESYGGKYAPGIAHKIAVENFKINLKGLLIGDGLSDPIHQYQKYADMGASFSLFDLNEKAHVEELQNQAVEYIQKEDWSSAYNTWDEICNQYFKQVTGNVNYYDVRKVGAYDWTNTVEYINLPSTRKLMNSGNHVYNRSSTIVYNNFKEDFSQSVVDYIIEALDKSNIRVLLYQGQFDFVCGTATTEYYMSLMNWSGQKEFNALKKRIWTNDEGVTIGYKKQYKNLYYAIVLGGGHLLPLDQPENSLALVTQFIKEKF